MSTLRQLRNFWIPWVMTIVLACFSDAVAQAGYTVTDLGPRNNDNLGCAMAVNNLGWTETMNGLMDPVSNARTQATSVSRKTTGLWISWVAFLIAGEGSISRRICWNAVSRAAATSAGEQPSNVAQSRSA